MSPEFNGEVVRPIAPTEIIEAKTEQIPGEVFAVFNTLIAQNIDHGRSRVLQKHVLEQLEAQGMNRSEIFKRHWLDVEESYREAGWHVKYDKPVYWGGEDFDAYFEFRSK